MKTHLLILLVTICAFGKSYAQVTRETMIQKRGVKKIISPPLPPQPAPPPPPPYAPPPASLAAPVYSLSGVTIKVKTGNDNKENLSQVTINLYNPSTNAICFQQTQVINAQFDIHSEMEFRLKKFFMQGRPDNAPSLLLSSLQTHGLRLEIGYSPNFIFDAWKLQGVVLVLEFSDQFGKPHPSLNSVPIHITNAVGLLGGGNHKMVCYIDKDFRSLNSVIDR